MIDYILTTSDITFYQSPRSSISPDELAEDMIDLVRAYLK
jgi:hypothetical protein